MSKINESGLKMTPLYDYYVENNVKLTDFGGWALPIQYTKILEEHQAVRNHVGLFDVAHMGEIRITGKYAVDFVNSLITNDATKIKNNQSMYTAITNEEGGTLDDVIFSKYSEEEILFTPNAANTEKIYHWFVQHNEDQLVKIEDVSDQYGLIALQGPEAINVLQKLTDTDVASIRPFYFKAKQKVAGIENVTISRTGYTGEIGFELYMPFKDQLSIWKELLQVGEPYGIKECGLGARDTLRLEAGLALYGNDLSESINPLEGGIGFTVKTGNKKTQDYPGKTALEAYQAKENKRQSRGFELKGKGIARQGMKVALKDGTEIGEVTSGTKSPTFNRSIGFILVDSQYAKLGSEVFIEIRNKHVPAVIVKKDWLKREE
jgi:aminomethyltransferase